MDKEKIVHDLALVHAQEKYREFLQSVDPKNRQFNVGISELINFYNTAVLCLAPQADEITDCYFDDDGNPVISGK